MVGLGLLLGGQTALADTVEMKNGDRITGRIISKSGETLKVSTGYGELQLQWEQVARLTSDDAVELMLDDKSLVSGSISTDADGRLRLRLATDSEDLQIDPLRISYINPPPDVSGKGVKVKARTNAGAAVYKGNTDTLTLHLDGEGVIRSIHNRYTLGAVYNYSEEKGGKTADNLNIYGKYDHFFTDNLYAYLSGSIYKDRFKDLHLRSTVGPGLGYQFYESDRTNLFAEAGATYLHKNYISQPDENNASGRWSLQFDHHLIRSRLQLFHNQEFLMGLKDLKEMLLRTQTGLRIPLYKGVNTGFQFNFDWERTPAAGTKQSDYGYLFTLGYSL